MAVILAVFCQSPLVEGDPGLLEVIKVAQKANLGRYPHGELRALLKTGQAGGMTLDERAEVHVIWDGSKSRTTLWKWKPIKREWEDTRPVEADREEWIDDGTKSTLYYPPSNLILINSHAKNPPPHSILTKPSDHWYGPGEMGLPWFDLLDPARAHPSVDRSQIRYHLTRKNGDIELIRTDGLPSELKADFSLENEGNVKEFHIKMTPRLGDHYTTDGKCEWVRDPLGRMYLSSREMRSTFEYPKEYGGRTTTYSIYKTISFSPDIKPTADRFEMNSLGFIPGVTVRDSTIDQTYRIGDPPVEKVTDSLDGLARKMRSKGFSKDDRNR